MVTPSGLPVGWGRVDAKVGDAVITHRIDPAAQGREPEARLLELVAATRQTARGEKALPKDIHAGEAAAVGDYLRVGPELVEWPKADKDALCLTVLSDSGSWINESIPGLLAGWLREGYRVRWVRSPNELVAGDLCFFLGCGQLVPPQKLRLHPHNLVVHASDLPKARGWSPMTWQILEGSNRIPVALLEANTEVDSGHVYLQEWLQFEGHELLEELRNAVGNATRALCRRFVADYPNILRNASAQKGEPSWYPKRGPADSELEVDLPLRDQFDLLHVVDNDHYPAFVRLRGHRYRLRIEKLFYE